MISPKVYNSKTNAQKWFIVYDGSSAYQVLGMDVQDEIENEDVEVLEGPYTDNEYLEDRVEILNDEIMGTKMHR